MKKILSLAAIAVIGLAVFSGCKKSSSTSTNMKATVGTTAVNDGNTLSFLDGTAVVIEGWSGNSTAAVFPYISIWINGTSIATGTYNFDSTTTTNYAEYISSASSFEVSKSGSVTITATSPNIVGTFNFTCTDGTVVSNGSFTVKHY